MAIKRASGIKTWRESKVGLQVFLAPLILERIKAKYQGDDPFNAVSQQRQVEMVLAEVDALLHHPDTDARRGARKALGLSEE